MSPQDLNPCPIIVRPNYKLNCVWCIVELKVIGNLECRIKFYREKKPRHFFYTIENPYPPTNSVAWQAGTSNRVVVAARQAGNRFLGSLKGYKFGLWTTKDVQEIPYNSSYLLKGTVRPDKIDLRVVPFVG